MRRVLVLVAHPDDEVLGCGGTLLALHRDDEVTVVILADGETSGDADRTTPLAQLSERRRAMARRAAAILHVHELVFLGLADQQLDRYPLLDVIRAVQPVIERVRPEVLYTHSQADLNRDHRVVGEAALVLTRPVPGCPTDEVYAFEIPAAAWDFGAFGRTFEPNVFVDVSGVLEAKQAAMAAYASELRVPPHPRSLDVLHASAVQRGALVGVPAAEAFELVRSVRRPRA